MQGARTPEELEELFEDAFVVRDHAGLVALFDDGAILAPGDGSEARGEDAIAAAAAGLWSGGGAYVGGARRVLQTRRTALVVARAGLHVARRSGDGAWRIAIAFLRPDDRPHEEDS